MLHLCKLAVGVTDLAQLRALQAARAAEHPPLRHRTRNHPRRAAEIVAGGSLYWVVGGVMLVRQRVPDIVADTWDDGRRCTAFILDPTLVPVAGRPVAPFQGWRYLAAQDAPADLDRAEDAAEAAGLPAAMRRDLRALGLL